MKGLCWSIRFVWFVGALLLASACADDSPQTFTERDDGSQVELSEGENFTLRLVSNPSTGYFWVIDTASPLDNIRLVASTFEAADTDAVGAPGTEVFEFEATSAGAGILRLTYERAFDDAPIPERIIELVVRVDGAAWPPDDPGVPATSGDSAPDGTLTVELVLESPFGRSVRVNGFVLWDAEGARLCQDLLESFPPQCGQPSMAIAHPEDLHLRLDEEGSVRWTPSSVEVDGSWDGEWFNIE